VRWFLPRNADFLHLFHEASDNIVAAVTLFRDTVADLSDLGEKVERLKELEHNGDRITHQTLAKLNTTFITPFDREDIHALIARLDDILDSTDAAAERLVIYRIDRIPPRVVALADVLLASVKEVRRAILALHDRKQHAAAMTACVEVNRLENEADAIHRQILGELFATETDAIALLKMKELCAFLEEATDRCEDVANVVESIIIKGS
jgi:predicted phosphate transport protein (TIGR00153 family)